MPDLDDVDIDLAEPDELSAPLASCEQRAACIVFDKSASDHLCEDHHRQEREDVQEGLGELLNEFGFQHTTDYISIDAEALCDYMGNLLSDTVTRCGRAATRVKMVTQEMMLCDKHARDSGHTPPDSPAS
jgi:hypothetical protein